MLLSLLASLALSFTVVPVMFHYLMSRRTGQQHHELRRPTNRNPLAWTYYGFNRGSTACGTVTAAGWRGASRPRG